LVQNFTSKVRDKYIPEGVKTSPLGHVPHSDGLVLGVWDDQVLARMKDGARDIVVVASASVDLPCLQDCIDMAKCDWVSKLEW